MIFDQRFSSDIWPELLACYPARSCRRGTVISSSAFQIPRHSSAQDGATAPRAGMGLCVLKTARQSGHASRRPALLSNRQQRMQVMTFRNGLASPFRPEDPVLALIRHPPYRFANPGSGIASLWEQPLLNKRVPNTSSTAETGQETRHG
jgi:hypothetical protein